MFSELCSPKSTWILSCEGILQVATLHHSSWSLPPLHLIFSSFLSSNTLFLIIPLYILAFFIYYSVIILLFASFCSFNSASHHHLHSIIMFSLLFSRREPSHLLNHLIKFVSSAIFFELITIFC